MLHAKMLDWIYSLRERGPSCDVGVGNIRRIERLAFACYRRGFEDGKKKTKADRANSRLEISRAKKKRKVRTRRTDTSRRVSR